MPLDVDEWEDHWFHEDDCPPEGRIHVRLGHWSVCLRPDGINGQRCYWPYSRHGSEGHWACRDGKDFFCAQDGCPNRIDKEVLIIELMALHPEYEGMLRFSGVEQENFAQEGADPMYGGMEVFREWWWRDHVAGKR